MEVRFCDELGFSVGWIAADRMMRAGHALATAEGVWVVDPIDAPGVEERVRALGDPAGVIQLTKSHRRDCATLAEKLAVSHHVVPVEPIPAAPFEFLPLADKRFWRESALWWPERRVLVCGDVLGTAPYFLAPASGSACIPSCGCWGRRARSDRSSPSTCCAATARDCTGPEPRPQSPTRWPRHAAASPRS